MSATKPDMEPCADCTSMSHFECTYRRIKRICKASNHAQTTEVSK
jgi:hypothetical protein